MPRIFMLLTACCVLLLAGPGRQDAAKRTDIVVGEKQAGKVTVKAPRPEVWYILPKANTSKKQQNLTSRLVPRIEEATRKAPF